MRQDYDAKLAQQQSKLAAQQATIVELKTELSALKNTSQRQVSVSEWTRCRERKQQPLHFPLCDLTGLVLDGQDLARAHLWNADLSGMHLARTNLTAANLGNANLSGANLSGANLSGANLSGANLIGATLPTDLRTVNLSNADLKQQDLRNHDLTGANLVGAKLTGADLTDADLTGALFDKGQLDYKVTAASVWLDGAQRLPSGVGGDGGWSFGSSKGSAPWTVDIDFGGFVVLNRVQVQNASGFYSTTKDITLQVHTGQWVDSQSHQFADSYNPAAWDTANLLTNRLRFKVNSSYNPSFLTLNKLSFFGHTL